MKDTALTFVEAAVDKVHYTLGLISGFGVVYELFRHMSGWRPKGGFWHYVLAVDWFVSVAVIYTFIAFSLGAILIVVLSSALFQKKTPERRKEVSARAGTTVLVLATIVGLVIAIVNRGGPVVHTSADIIGIIFFRLIGFIAIAMALLLIFGAYQKAHQHKWHTK